MYDFILCSIPKSDVYSPLIGLPILKGVLNNNNYTSKILDFNIELYYCYKTIFAKHNFTEWTDLDYMFRKQIDDVLYNNLLEKWANTIVDYNPRFVGFTMFSSHNYNPLVALSKLIRQKNPNIKIVVGGPVTKWLGQLLLDKKLIDYYVIGYGEEAILKIIKDEPFVGVNDNNRCRKLDLNKTPFPDFSDLDISQYITKDGLFTYSSRGCTQHCSFCDVNDIWNGYNTRAPERVIEEMMNCYSKYNIRRFEFCDSLINGNLTHMRSLCIKLKLYDFNWQGMFRIRKMNDQDYDLLKDSGCTLLKMGIESGNEIVRNHMGKYFTNEEVLNTLDNLSRVKINAALFFVTGYPTESEQDHQESKDLIKEISERNYTNISHIRTAPLEIQRTELESLKDTGGQTERYNRYHELRQYILDKGFNIIGDKRINLLVKGYEDKRNIN